MITQSCLNYRSMSSTMDQAKLCHYPPPSSTTHHHPTPSTTHHHPPPPTTSQNIFTTIHHHPPQAKIYPPPSTTIPPNTTQKMGYHPAKAKIYSYIAPFDIVLTVSFSSKCNISVMEILCDKVLISSFFKFKISTTFYVI